MSIAELVLGHPKLIVVAISPFIGSFLGVLVLRLPKGGDVLWTRSTCDHCGRRLGIADLVPLLSWLLLHGRCRYCGAAIGAFYPAIELASLGTALWAAAATTGWVLWVSCLLGWSLLVLAVTDWREYMLPHVLTWPLVAVGLAVTGVFLPAQLAGHAIGALAGFVIIVAIGYIYRFIRGREGIGGGDAALLAAGGAWTSWVGIPSIVLYGSLSALLVVIGRRLLGERIDGSSRIPFGTFLCLGIWLVWLYGPMVPAIGG